MSTAPLSNVSPMASPSAKQLRHRFAATVAAIWRAASGANSIAVPRALIRLLGGDIKAAVMLSQAVVWQREALDTQPRDHGWFYRSAADWHAATRLTPREQERIRRKLVSLGFLQVERNGYPATLQFYPDVPAMAAAIGCREQELFPRPRHGEPLAPTTDVRQVDRSVSLLGRIIYLPELMDVCEQNAGATLLLCHLLGLHFWHNVTYGQAVYWFTSSAAELEFATGLPEKAQLLARRVLQRQQMILERRLRPEAPLEYQLYLRGVLAAFIRAGGSIGSPAALPVAELDPPRVVDQVGQPTRRPGSSIRVGRYVANGAGKSAARIVGAFDQLERAELDPILTAAPLTAGTRPSSPTPCSSPAGSAHPSPSGSTVRRSADDSTCCLTCACRRPASKQLRQIGGTWTTSTQTMELPAKPIWTRLSAVLHMHVRTAMR
ncbi:hypothetical protein [Chitinimonas koreensis]|uniref:hypothetical protein n=1 Tax=Chitinimonas koreensis TaxID=356302 RepID=UPI0016545F5C|nr:hypothetical protein [Chitinimonas koreensis]QNM95462.1 hypothetical protein H9L41_16540 [Chitinimonas koreensis]